MMITKKQKQVGGEVGRGKRENEDKGEDERITRRRDSKNLQRRKKYR
jgi:hypothetical protein